MTVSFIAVESFLDPALAAEVWPKNISTDKFFIEQLMRRKELHECLEDIVSRLPRPDITLETAINQGYLTEEQVANLYIGLSDLLSDREYGRLILYLPFEFLPKAPERFKQVYMEDWERLLSVYDVRANFVDGDVLEVEQRVGDLPRVVKAAHLIPILVENGFMEVRDVLMLMEESDDQILKDSIADTLPVLADMGFLAEKEIKPREKRIKQEPKFITERRKAWLEWKEKEKKQKTIIIGSKQRLMGPFSENLKLMKEFPDIQRMTASIESDMELSQLIYPIVLVFGSRLNGYGDQNADIDIGIFVKPETPFNDRPRLQKLLRKTFTHEKIIGEEIKEFWLKEKEGRLEINDFTECDASLGENCWTHVLFGAAWLGSQDTMRELCKKLLVPYMYNTDARSLYIENMERATLQYRLMHKGYERFFPRCGGINTPHAEEIDSDSMFYDSGYRQLATRLFISRVFLPKIPAP